MERKERRQKTREEQIKKEQDRKGRELDSSTIKNTGGGNKSRTPLHHVPHPGTSVSDTLAVMLVNERFELIVLVTMTPNKDVFCGEKKVINKGVSLPMQYVPFVIHIFLYTTNQILYVYY